MKPVVVQLLVEEIMRILYTTTVYITTVYFV